MADLRPIPAVFLTQTDCNWATLREKRTGRAQISLCAWCGTLVRGEPAPCPVAVIQAPEAPHG